MTIPAKRGMDTHSIVILDKIEGERAWSAGDRAAGTTHPDRGMPWAATEAHYLAIANAPANVWAEIGEEQADEALNVLPPIYVPHGFMVSEACTANTEGHSVYLCVKQSGGRYFAAYRTRKQVAA